MALRLRSIARPARPSARTAATTLVVVAGLALACSTPRRAEREATPVPYQWIAPDLDRAALSTNERRGFDLYVRDVATHRATASALAEAELAQRPVRGWIVVPHERGFLVRYVDASERVIIDVSVDPWSALSPYVMSHPSPKDLSAREAAMWRARQLAIHQTIPRCTERFDVVVIPESDDGDADWLVYLLAIADDPARLAIGGHHRFRVDADGRALREHVPLSVGCLSAEYEPESAGFAMTQSVAREPVETQVFLNLLHGIPLFVRVVETGEDWEIEGGRIRRLAGRKR